MTSNTKKYLCLGLFVLSSISFYVWASFLDKDYRDSLAEVRKQKQEQWQEEKKAAEVEAVLEAEASSEGVFTSYPYIARIPNSFHQEGKKLPSYTQNVRAGLVIDLNSKETLWSKNAQENYSIASLTKIFTCLLAFEKLKANTAISPETKVTITSSARSVASSSFLRKYPLREVPIHDLLLSAIVKSANDSCALMSEFFGNGNSDAYIAELNERVKALGFSNSRFTNPHGLPLVGKKDNTSTLADVANAAIALTTYPEVISWTRKSQHYLPKGHARAIPVNNTNRLVARPGVTGLKTGFTNNAGWCLCLTYSKDGRNFLVIATGCQSKSRRDQAVSSLLNWAIKND